jgi:small-conductance mechanosensitive channel
MAIATAAQDLREILSFGDDGVLRMAVVIPVVILVLVLTQRLILRHDGSVSGHRFRGQMLMLLLTLVGVVAVILSLPLDGDRKDDLLNFLGLLLSAAIALSSTTFLGNILAGFMLRSLHNFRVGDFIRVEEHFGRVTERGLFHIEVQTEDRDLTTLSNMFLTTHPMTVVRATGTILTASVSLGYDVPRVKVRELLKRAAEEAELKDPFVRIVSLGDYSVTYTVGGLLTEVREMISRRTKLRGRMLDALHDGGIEIVSPTVMTTRPLSPDDRLAPRTRQHDDSPAEPGLEVLAFDKADKAQSVEELRAEVEALGDERAELQKRHKGSKDASVRQALEDELERLEQREERLRGELAKREAELVDADQGESG